MSPAMIQLIAVAGPQVVALLMEAFKTVSSQTPEAITPEQWKELQKMFSEDYDARKARILAELRATGVVE